MRKVSLYLSAMLVSMGVTAPAYANTPDSFTLRLSAQVAPYCKIWFDGSEQISVVDGKADIGNVREVCNTRYGYNITANFMNLNAGKVSADGDTAMVDNLGVARFSYGEAGANNRFWRLSEAVPVAAESPVYMQVVISPI